MVWEHGWEERAKLKLTGTVLLSSIGSIVSSQRQRVSIRANLPLHVAGYSGIMALFTVIQETLRGVRSKHDAINSFVGGTLAGGLAAGYFQGPKYRLLGALVWGPMCSLAHVANDAFKPRLHIEDLLVSEGLLSPIVVERRLQQEAAHAQHTHLDATSGREEPRSTQEEVERIRRREMALLLMQRAQAQQPASTSQGLLSPSSEAGGMHSRGLTATSSSSSSSGGGSDMRAEGGAHSTTSSSGRSTNGKLGWWAWLRGIGRQRDAGEFSSSQGSSRAEQGDRDGGHDGGEEDVSGFKEWLGSQTLSKDGLVVPASG